MKSLLAVLALSALGSPSLASADSIPAGAQAQVETQISADPSISGTYKVKPGPTATASAATSNSTASTSIDLRTGILRAGVQGTTSPFAGSEGFDFLSFTMGGRTSATISYSFGVDGTLSNTDPSGFANGADSFRVYDVTGLSNYFTSYPIGPGQFYQQVSSGIPLVYTASTDSFIYGSKTDLTFIGATIPNDTDNLYLSESGVPIPIAYTQSGSFQVLADHLYLVDLYLIADNSSGYTGNKPNDVFQSANFSNTAKFSFTDLDGASYTSSSGTFLSGSPVPEPSSLALLGTGAIGLLIKARQRFRRP